MISKIIYEQQGVSDDEAEVINLLKNDFDNIQTGDIIAEVETSKAIIEVEANSNGYIKFICSLNEIIKVGDIIAIIGENLKVLDELPKSSIEDPVVEKSKEKSISAKTLKIAKSLNISEEILKDHEIFTVNEIKAYAERKSNEKILGVDKNFFAKFKSERTPKNKLSEIDNLRLAQSLTLPCSCSIMLEDFNIDTFSKKHNLYFDNIFPVMADICSKEIKKFNNLNGFFHDKKKYLYEDINIGFTIDNKEYLQVPVIHNCDKYSIEEIQDLYFELTKSSLTDKISLTEVSKPTFIISDLSSVGDCFFHTPLLAPFTSAILGLAIDKLACRLVLTLTYDHQMSSGKEALLFLEAVRSKLYD